MTQWYCHDELAVRLALFFVGSAVSGMLGGFLAYGLLSINDGNGLGPFADWQVLFLFEGTSPIHTHMDIDMYTAHTHAYAHTYPTTVCVVGPIETVCGHQFI
jgi:hypothetical protein